MCRLSIGVFDEIGRVEEVRAGGTGADWRQSEVERVKKKRKKQRMREVGENHVENERVLERCVMTQEGEIVGRADGGRRTKRRKKKDF